MLGGQRSAPLRAAMFGLLMLLPQSDAFHALRNRLTCARVYPDQVPDGVEDVCWLGPAETIEPAIDFDKLFKEFLRVQAAHREFKMLDRTRGKLLD